MQLLSYLISAVAAFQFTHLKLFQAKEATIKGLDAVTDEFSIKVGAYSSTVSIGMANQLMLTANGGAFVGVIRDGTLFWPERMASRKETLPSDNITAKLDAKKHDIVIIVLPHGTISVARDVLYKAFKDITANTYTDHVKKFCEPLSGKDMIVATLYVKDDNFAEQVDIIKPIKVKTISPRKTVVVTSTPPIVSPVVVQDTKQTHTVRRTGSGTNVERNVRVDRVTSAVPDTHHTGGSIFGFRE